VLLFSFGVTKLGDHDVDQPWLTLFSLLTGQDGYGSWRAWVTVVTSHTLLGLPMYDFAYVMNVMIEQFDSEGKTAMCFDERLLKLEV
jgi:hypothetical protein